MNNNINVLYIDDEQNNLNSFKANFRFDFNVFLTSDLSDATQILKDNDIQVVVCDLKMPVNGIDMLQQLTCIKPNIVKILLTAYSDISDVVNAINSAHIYYYINKPFEYLFLKEKIIDSYKHYMLTTLSKDFIEIVNRKFGY
jgi:response regulator RpfG family c-di-GMP phosphodiesterase